MFVWAIGPTACFVYRFMDGYLDTLQEQSRKAPGAGETAGADAGPGAGDPPPPPPPPPPPTPAAAASAYPQGAARYRARPALPPPHVPPLTAHVDRGDLTRTLQ